MKPFCQVMAKPPFALRIPLHGVGSRCWRDISCAGRECLVTFQAHAEVAYNKRSLGCPAMVKCWWHEGCQKSAGSNMWVAR